MRKYLSVVTFAFLLGVVGSFLTYRAQAQTAATTTQTLTPISRTAMDEYANLLKANATQDAVRTWAKKYDLTILSFSRNRLEVTTNRSEFIDPTQVQTCDPTKCGWKTTSESLTNTQGVITGMRVTTCTPSNATSCSFIKDPTKPGSWLRICNYSGCKTSIQSIG